jgi:hypothetical protein
VAGGELNRPDASETKETPVRHNGRPALNASQIRPSNITLHPGEPVTVVCADCRTWRKLTRGMIPAHRSTDPGCELRDNEGKLIKRDTRCPGSGQRIEIDLTLAQWVGQIEDGLTEVAARRPTKVLRKIPTPKPPAVIHMAQPRPAAPAPTAAQRSKQWAERLPAVHHTDMVRRVAVLAGPGDTRRRVYGPELPTEDRDTREQSRELAKARTSKVIREASPLRKRAAA